MEGSMFQLHLHRQKSSGHTPPVARAEEPIYTREAFRAILSRQPEWKIRAALEEGDIPSPNVEHAVEWLQEQEANHKGYFSS
jgi:hypothetical protein